ncbi:hypothetical protein [Stappia sp.]|uniref:hypothetical protein n=1 Tax=Stappia sp. TaxID=1870903 RepID=UPI003A993E2B
MTVPIFRKSILAATLFTLLSTSPTLAIEPFDAMRDSANGITSKAEQAGDALIKALGEQMLKTIDAMEATALRVIAEGKDAALVVEGQLFRDISRTIERLEANEKIVVSDMTKLTANWASLISRLPLVDARPEVMFYRPRVLAKDGPSVVPLTIVGPGLAGADPAMRRGAEELEVGADTDNSLTVQLPRSAFSFPETEPAYVTLPLAFNAAAADPWWSWSYWNGEPVERTITLMLLPEVLATYEIETTVTGARTERKAFASTTNARGKDSFVNVTKPVPPTDLKAGWRFDTAAILAGHYKHERTRDTGGSSCSGVDPESLTASRAVLRHQIGHRNEAFNRTSDGNVDCSLELPMVRTIPTTKAGPVLDGQITTTGDLDLEFGKDTSDYRITVKLFTGQTYIVKKDIDLPYGIIEVDHSNAGVHFRPKPPADF